MTEIPQSTIEAVEATLPVISSLNQRRRRARRLIQAMLDDGGVVLASELDEVVSESAKLGMRGGMIEGQLNEAKAELAALREAAQAVLNEFREAGIGAKSLERLRRELER